MLRRAFNSLWLSLGLLLPGMGGAQPEVAPAPSPAPVAVAKAELPASAASKEAKIKVKAEKPVKSAKSAKSAQPKESYVSFAARDPSQTQLSLILEAAQDVGMRPGLAVLIDHESAQSWHEWVRPSHPDKPRVRVTTDGKVVGEPSSSAVGLTQSINATWMHWMYTNGEELITQAKLEQKNPQAAQTIRQARELMTTALGKKPADQWDSFNSIENDKTLMKNPVMTSLLALRSDSTHRIPVYALFLSFRDNARELEKNGLPVTPTSIYGVHQSGIGTIKTVYRNRGYVAADDPKMAEAARINGGIFVKADGSGKTSDEVLQTYAGVMSEGRVTAFERKFFGRDFSFERAKAPAVAVQDAATGERYTIRPDLFVPRLPVSDFAAAWAAPRDDVPAVTFGPVSQSLQAMGFLKLTPKPMMGPGDMRYKQALASFKLQAGLPYADDGKVDALTLRYLKEAQERASQFVARQKTQQSASASINLKTYGQDYRALSDEQKRGADSQIITIKEQLRDAGYLAQPVERVKTRSSKGRVIYANRDKPFDATPDRAMIKAVSAFHQANGLKDDGRISATSLYFLANMAGQVKAKKVSDAQATLRTEQPVAKEVLKAPAAAVPPSPAPTFERINPRSVKGIIQTSRATQTPGGLGPLHSFAQLTSVSYKGPHEIIMAQLGLSLAERGAKVDGGVAPAQTGKRKLPVRWSSLRIES